VGYLKWYIVRKTATVLKLELGIPNSQISNQVQSLALIWQIKGNGAGQRKGIYYTAPDM
jgi:hypothetical protein